MRTINFLLLLLSISSAHAAGIEDIFSDMVGIPGSRVSYRGSQNQKEIVRGSPLTLWSRQQEVDASLLMSKKLRLQLHGNLDEVDTKVRFPNGHAIPSALWDLSVGVSHSSKLENGRFLGTQVSIGSASDRPFSALRDLNFQGNLVYRVPNGHESAWIYFLNMSTTRSFLNYIPLPGAGYYFKARENLRMLVGVPFVWLNWNPSASTYFNFSYMPISLARFRFDYFFGERLDFFLTAKFQSRHYMLADRTASKESLYYSEGLAEAGFSVPVKILTIDVGGGYSFDRKYFLGEKINAWKNGQVLYPGKGALGFIRTVANF